MDTESNKIQQNIVQSSRSWMSSVEVELMREMKKKLQKQLLWGFDEVGEFDFISSTQGNNTFKWIQEQLIKDSTNK